MNIFDLHLLCDILSACTGKAGIHKLHDQIQSGDVIWENLIDIAHDQMLAPALWTSLSTKQLAGFLPANIRDYLQQIHALNENRNSHLRGQVLEAVGALNRESIVPLLFKGAAHLIEPIQGDIGSRMMLDLDVLIPAEQLPKAVDTLTGLGYEEAPEEGIDNAGHHHWTPLFRPGDFGSIELHREAFPLYMSHLLPASLIWKSAQLCEIEGRSFYVPSATHTALLLILNSQVADRCHNQHLLDLRSLNDFSAAVMEHPDDIDWLLVHSLMKKYRLNNVFNHYLFCANRLFHLPYPPGIDPGAKARWHYAICLVVWKSEPAERLLSAIDEFSSDYIQQKYRCEKRPLPLAVGRIKHFDSKLKAGYGKGKKLMGW